MNQYRAKSQKQSTSALEGNPSSGFNKIYPKSDGLFYTLDSSGNEKVLINATITSLLSDDRIVYNGTSWINEANQIGEAYMSNNATATTIGTAGTFVKAAGTTTAGSLSQFTHTTNRLTYTGTRTVTKLVSASVSFFTGSNNQTLSARIAENGTVLASSESSARQGTASQPVFALSKTFVTFNTNDYVELWVTNQSGATNVTVEDMNLTIL